MNEVERDSLPDRRHPHRLHAEAYRETDEVAFVTICAKAPHDLAGPGPSSAIVTVMARMARRRKVRIHAYCILPDHIHVVGSVHSEGGDIAAWLRYTKREVAKALGRRGMWLRSYWDRHARAHEDVAEMVGYVLANPVRRGMCEGWQDWPHSWSEWHEGTQGADPNE